MERGTGTRTTAGASWNWPLKSTWLLLATLLLILLRESTATVKKAGRRLLSQEPHSDGALLGKWPCLGRGQQLCNGTAHLAERCPKPCQPGNCRGIANRDFWQWEDAILEGAYDNVFVREESGEFGDICASVCRSADRSAVLSDAECIAGRQCGSNRYCSALDCPPPLSYSSCRKAGSFWAPTCEVCARLFPACATLPEDDSADDDNKLTCGKETVFVINESNPPQSSEANQVNDEQSGSIASEATSEQEPNAQHVETTNVEAASEEETENLSEWACESEPEGVCIRRFIPGEVCREWGPYSGESTVPFTVEEAPYADVIAGQRSFETTFPQNSPYETCRFVVPPRALPPTWVEECIANMEAVGYLNGAKGRPNPDCPAGWFLCQGMCYTIVQRQSMGPTPVGEDASDYASLEARCGLCGGARVAFVGADAGMEAVTAAAAKLAENDDKAIWVRRFRFLTSPNLRVESRDNPYQPWHRYVVMAIDNPWQATYQRYYTGELDGLSNPRYDMEYRNQPASILCVNTIPRIVESSHWSNSRVEKATGCKGDEPHEMWADEHHIWRPESHWPYPGL